MAKDDDDFKFPDETEASKGKAEESIDVSVEEDGDVKIEVEDDTPAEDRYVAPLSDEVKEELEKVDESKDYSHNVKTKFKQYKKAWHDERRAKEAAYREQQEALQIAQNILEENKKLKNLIHNGEKELISTYQSSAEMEMEQAKRNFKDAYDSGEADKLLDAQQEMMKAQLKLDKAKNFKPTVQTQENDVQTAQKPPVQQQMDPKVSAWVSKNEWFVDPNKRGMRRFAEGVHEDLAERYGRAYIGTDEYFKSIDKEVHKRFPEEFASSQNNDEDEPPQRTRPSTVVAPAKRSTAPKKIVLSKTQVGLAKKFGITPEQYARELMKLEA
jgi:hypothetical protein